MKSRPRLLAKYSRPIHAIIFIQSSLIRMYHTNLIQPRQGSTRRSATRAHCDSQFGDLSITMYGLVGFMGGASLVPRSQTIVYTATGDGLRMKLPPVSTFSLRNDVR